MASQVLIAKNYVKFLVLVGLLVPISFSIFYSSCTSDEAYKNHDKNVGYVGMEKCKSCHEDKHATFIHTGMGKSFSLATKEKSLAQFGPEHIVYDSFNNMTYFPFWKNDSLFIKEFRIEEDDTTYQQVQHITYIVGSGQHTNSHLINKNGYIFQAPLTFYVQEQKWDLPPGYENGNNSRFSRILNVECMSCHNSMPELEAGSDNKFLSIGSGIDCERCHGPGELHVKEREAGNGVDVKTEIDYTIVNPRKLSWERQIDVCQRCHLQGLNVLKNGKSFTDFVPGMKLSDVFEIYLPEYEGGQSEFDMANHSARLQMSQCFIQSNQKNLDFTCITCHNPHISVEQTGNGVYNSACKSCHTSEYCSENKEKLLTANNNCVTCHMPSTGTEDIPHVSVHDHFIRKPGKVINDDEAKLIGLYAVNNETPEAYYQIKAYLEYWEKFDKNPFYLKQARILLALNPDEKEDLWIKYRYLQEEYFRNRPNGIDENKSDAWTLFMMGFSQMKQDKKSQAKYYLEKAAGLKPYDLIINKSLLDFYADNGYSDEGISFAKEMHHQFPMDGEIVKFWAKALVVDGNLKEGIKRANESLALNPDDLESWEILLNAYVRMGKQEEAKEWAKRIVSKQPNHAAKDLLR